ncbi:unnamed protein product, partial [Scytosiphon promiscuus]
MQPLAREIHEDGGAHGLPGCPGTSGANQSRASPPPPRKMITITLFCYPCALDDDTFGGCNAGASPHHRGGSLDDRRAISAAVSLGREQIVPRSAKKPRPPHRSVLRSSDSRCIVARPRRGRLCHGDSSPRGTLPQGFTRFGVFVCWEGVRLQLAACPF